MDIEFEEWTQDINFPSGYVEKDVIFVRASSGDISYITPILSKDDKEQAIRDAKALLFVKITGQLHPELIYAREG
jgi:hypothetical protein